MSRSNPTANSSNPATRFFEWSSKNKCMGYYDKEKEDRVKLKLPFRFIYLDEMSTVSGYNQKVQSGIYANEVRDTKAQRLVVRYFKPNGQVIATGYWEDIKDKVTVNKGRFAKTIYCAYRGGANKLELGACVFHGASLGAWFDFTKKNKRKIEQEPVAVVITGSVAGTTGSVEFNSPAFTTEEISEKAAAEAAALDVQLQKYLSEYLSRTPSAPQSSPTSPNDNPPTDHAATDDAPADGDPVAEDVTTANEDDDNVPF